MNDNEREILERAIGHYGTANQMLKTFEELGELGTALARYQHAEHTATKDDVITELADVSIMVDQMAMIFGREDFEAERERKIKRLDKRIKTQMRDE